MGQGLSSRTSAVDVSQYPPDLKKLHSKAESLKEKLEMLKMEGKSQKKKQKKELKALTKEKMELHVTLMKLGKHAQRHFSFWEYVRIVRTTFDSSSAVPAIQGSSLTLKTEDSKEDKKPKTTAIVKQSDVVHYTIFAFYEAYLLKKLHIAMMLKNQKKLHAKGWNDLVMFLYYEIPKVESEFENAEARLMNQKNEDEGRKSHVEECYRAHIANQRRLLETLNDGVEGKVREAPLGSSSEFSFKKKSEPRDTSSFSSRSNHSSGSSGSFQKKSIRSNTFSTQKDNYQTPWMKSSRRKIAKSTQKAAEETAARPPKFESSLKKFEEEPDTEEEPVADDIPEAAEATAVEEPSEVKEPVADEKPSTDDTPVATEAIAVEKPSEQKEPVADEKPSTDDTPVATEAKAVEKPSEQKEPVADENPSTDESPDATETTAKSTEDKEGEPEEENRKKKKKKALPKGMPETLEIVTSDDECTLDGEGSTREGSSRLKKKKKKKKKSNLEDSEHMKKKKKKKKASSNSSVVSELSYGS